MTQTPCGSSVSASRISASIDASPGWKRRLSQSGLALRQIAG